VAKALRWLTHCLYNRCAWAYDPVSWFVSLGQWSRWRSAALGYLAGGRVLEIGFGTGELLLEMRRCGIECYGLDLSPAMQRITARKLRRWSLRAPRVRADARAMPFAAASFDAVVSTFPAEYVLSPDVMAEVARLLTKRGRLVVAGLYVESDSPFLRLLAWLVSGGDASPAVNRFTQAAADAGLAVTIASEQGRGFRLPVFSLEKASAP